MAVYQEFAAVYDLFMDNVPYEKWGAFLISQMRRESILDGLVVDLGCGTGKMTRLLAAAGYDMIGIDCSPEMLSVARASEDADGASGILYLCQDMREFELYGTVRAVISVCDSLNYILEEKELRQVFSLVDNYLDPGGVFLFDFNTDYKYRETLGDTVICENRREGSFIWENYYDAGTRINEYALTFYIRQDCGLYERFEETHLQKGYTLAQMKSAAEWAGLKFVAAYDAESGGEVSQISERIFMVLKEQKK